MPSLLDEKTKDEERTATKDRTEATGKGNIQIVGKLPKRGERILTSEALDFIAALHDRFERERESLLIKRIARQKEIDAGQLPDFLTDTQEIVEGDWQVATTPADLQDRRVEITGPTDRKMMINALNSGAKVFMADLEDSMSPTWSNVIDGQLNLIDAVQGQMFYSSAEGRLYRLKTNVATLVLRPRGWHLTERHVLVDGKPISASLFDFGMYFFHNAKELIAHGSGPYFYLPKLESHHEARLWNNVFNFAQDYIDIPRGTIRATILIETILAAFEMEEILFELKEHASGLNAGRWDYIFSLIKKTRNHANFVLPDRAQVTMNVPFMRAYAKLLVQTCHRRGAHAIGGMAAFIPSRKNEEINANAFAKVLEDKQREANDGFDGTWVAHPDLVKVAQQQFDAVLHDEPHQKRCLKEAVQLSGHDLLSTKIADANVTRAGLANNIDVALQYIESWLRGIGAAGIHNLMEDAATAEIARAQIWQWIKWKVQLDDGSTINETLYVELKNAQMAKLTARTDSHKFQQAAEILDRLVLSKDFEEFLTIPAYEILSD